MLDAPAKADVDALCDVYGRAVLEAIAQKAATGDRQGAFKDLEPLTKRPTLTGKYPVLEGGPVGQYTQEGNRHLDLQITLEMLIEYFFKAGPTP
jgi:hypothetical protein